MNGAVPPPGGPMQRLRAGWLVLAKLLLLWLCAGAAQAAITITAKSFVDAPTLVNPSIFYTNTAATPQMVCSYQAFGVSSTVPIADAWVRIENFTGGFLGLGGGDDGIFQIGPLASTPRTVYFYVCSSYAEANGITTGQGYTVNVYNAKPTLGGVLQGGRTFPLTIDNSVQQAGANKVTTIVAGPNPPVLGGVITLTVQGETGTIGNSPYVPGLNGPLSFTPAAAESWRADAYELVSTSISFSGANSGTVADQLYFANLASGANTNYVITYSFRAVTTTIVPSALSPIGHIYSGGLMKHTTTSSFAGLGLIDGATNTLTLAKTVNAATLPASGGTLSYTLRLSNSSSYPISVDDIVDTLPTSPAAANYVSGSSSFGGVAIANPAISGAALTWGGPFVVPAGGFRDLVFQATIPGTPGLYTNSAIAQIGATQIDTTLTTTDDAPATAQTRVLLAPVIAKSFSPSATAVGVSLRLTLTLSNPNTADTLAGVGFTDTYGGSLLNSAAPNLATTCVGGSLTGGAPGGGFVGISGLVLAAGASCTISIDVTSVTATAGTNTTGNVSSSNGGVGNAASAPYTFTAQPTLVKSFTPAFIAPGGASVLRIVVANNSGANLTALAFGDAFPAGLVVAGTPGLTNTCAGTVEGRTGAGAFGPPAAGNTEIRLTGGAITLPATSCQIELNVTAPTGQYNNTTTGANSNIAGTGPASNTALLSVNFPPVVAKAFSPASISRNGTSLLTITLSNSNATPITGVSFTDTYLPGVPSGALVNAATPLGTTTCGPGTVTALAGGASVALTGGTIPANGSCTVTVNVTSTTAASYFNETGIVSTANAGNGAAASATLIVSAAPSVVKSFSANPVTGFNTLSITITNNHTAGITAVAFTDTFPAGLSVAPTTPVPPAPTNTCGGTFSATANATSISLSGGAIATVGGTCTLTVPVVAASSGLYNNQTSGVSSSIGTGNPSNIATLIAPALTKSFSPTIVGPGDPSVLTIRVTNPSLTTALTGVRFSDTYPTNMRNVSAILDANTCGGTATASGPATNPGTLLLVNGTVPAGGSCIVSVKVNATIGAIVPTNYQNQTGTVRSNQGVGIDAADTLYVTNRPTITKTFSDAAGTTFSTASTILTTQTSILRLVVENNHTTAISGLSLSDPLPAGMTAIPATTTGVTANNSCGGTLTVTASSITLSGGSIVGVTPTGSCTIRVTVSGSTAGVYPNQTSGAVSTTISPNPGPPSNVATLTVNLNPISPVSKSFTPNAIGVNGTSTITITLNNPNATAITGASFTDTYPSGLTTAGAPTLTNCGAATVSAPAAGGTLTLSGATIPANGACTVTVPVTATLAGTYTNPSFTVTTTNAGTAVSATAALNVYAAPTISKLFATNPVNAGVASALSFTITNPAANPGAINTIAFGDLFPTTPGAMTLANASTSNTCGGTLEGRTGAGAFGAPVAGNTEIRLTGASTLAAGANCTVVVNVSASVAGSYVNTSSAVTAQSTVGAVALTGATASATLTVTVALNPDLALTKIHAGNFVVGATHSYTLTVNNLLGSLPTSGTITVVDTLPSGLSYVAAGSGGTGWTCGAAGQVVTCTSAAVIAAGATSANPITINVAVGAAAQPGVTNRATVSGGAEPGGNTGNNTVFDYTVVQAAPVNSFLTDGAQTAPANSVLFYTHQFTAGSDGTVAFSTVSLPSPAIAGWSNILYRDSNCNGTLDGAEGALPLLAPIAMLAGEQVCIIVKEFVPAGASTGAQDQITVTAAFTPSVGAPQNYTRSDVTTVGSPGLTLAKAVRNISSGGPFGASNTALPGQTLEYRITYTNIGSGALSNLVINDTTPPFTNFVSATCGGSPPNITLCAVTTQPGVGLTGAIAWTLTGTLAPGSQSTVLFQVNVQP